METPYLDKMIEDLQNHIEHVESVSHAGIPETRKELKELEAIKAKLKNHGDIGDVIESEDVDSTFNEAAYNFRDELEKITGLKEITIPVVVEILNKHRELFSSL
jgi:hypothetical protein